MLKVLLKRRRHFLNLFFYIQTSVFHSKFHNYPACKMNRDKQGGAAWKFDGFRENTFWITPKSFCCNWDLYFNLQSNTLPDQINGFIPFSPMRNMFPNSLINSWNFREWNMSIIYVKFEMWSPLLCEFPSYFQQWSLN